MSFARFIKSAVDPKDYPPDKGVEVAIAGRSNAGKSSLINAMVTSRVAKVSATPGKTRLLNFFNMNNKYTLVDMPGYGFAKRPGAEREEWRLMVEDYMVTRRSLKGMILVMDIRRSWTEEEQILKDFTDRSGIPMAVILTKSDKCTKSEIAKSLREVREDSTLDSVFVVSSLKRTGHAEFEEWMFQTWIEPLLGEKR
jgi:GTP-binding protein